jgi:hypothetical protein
MLQPPFELSHYISITLRFVTECNFWLSSLFILFKCINDISLQSSILSLLSIYLDPTVYIWFYFV